MHKIKRGARSQAWHSGTESANYNPWNKPATRLVRQNAWGGQDIWSTNAAPSSRQDAGFGSLSDLDLPVRSREEEAVLECSQSGNIVDFGAQSDHSLDAQPAYVPDACLDPVPDAQPALVASSHKPSWKGKFGTRGKNEASRKIAEIGLAFIEHGAIAITGPVGQNPLTHQRSIIFVEYGSRDPLAPGK